MQITSLSSILQNRIQHDRWCCIAITVFSHGLNYFKVKCSYRYLFCNFFQTKASPLVVTPLIAEECTAHDRCTRLQMKILVPRPVFSGVGLWHSLSPGPGRSEHLKCWSPHLQSGSGPIDSSAPDSPPCWTFGTKAYIHSCSELHQLCASHPRLSRIWVLSDQSGTCSRSTASKLKGLSGLWIAAVRRRGGQCPAFP